MGSTLARVLLEKGHRITVWNRTSAKAEPLVRKGATLASSLQDAIRASPVIITCVTSYQATRSLLESEPALPSIAGRLLVQLSTGTPQDARDSEAWAHEHGAEYLDGAILAFPDQVGKETTPIVVSGPYSQFQKCEPILRSLAGGLQHVGEPVGVASTWDMGFLSSLWGATLGFLHGARIFESEGLRVDTFGTLINRISPLIGEMAEYECQVIQSEKYDRPQASVSICSQSVELLTKQAQQAGINPDIPVFTHGLFKKAIAAGYGDEEFGAVIKVLRK
ncbi:beta-hydroxyacid dehydrogenase [Basidiobolus meristosporus CBS 931.73]|uniref:Beta-hydroxyacid dehydrogenase n=1 Tax=Basidiobolus meristosporus CBS 931.73 TaxID=1314790 RepID=A0A1Y1YIV8_9FUNG|nr:beta-hydroxyacid dehydrogenase [Basidiobolus meristosporus CBS 931.73]|eukprot:ORX97919.1 beta-hydroxyacid dehydrogenase [Basidiobolus meristosporus CBS 931.73]